MPDWTRNLPSGLAGTLVFSLVFFSAGTAIVFMGLDVIHVPEESIHAPRWVIILAGAAFVFASLSIALDAVMRVWHGGSEVLIALKGLITFLLMAAFAAPFHWAAFGSGEGTLTTTVSTPFMSTSRTGADGFGRLLFGAMAILMDVAFLFFGFRSVVGWLRGGEGD